MTELDIIREKLYNARLELEILNQKKGNPLYEEELEKARIKVKELRDELTHYKYNEFQKNRKDEINENNKQI